MRLLLSALSPDEQQQAADKQGFGKAFQEQIRGHLGHWEVEDLVAGRKWLVQQGIAEPSQVLLTGWSWGGI